MAEGFAQEIKCNVNCNFEAVATSNKDLLNNFQSDISNYFLNYPWGNDSDIKVTSEISIFIQSATGDNRYSAQAVIVSQRERLGTEKNTAVFRVKDDTWDFTYVQNRNLNHNPSEFNELTSFLDFYAYVILGYDYDTYEELGGTPWFRKAADVANLGRSSGLKGWQGATGSYSRTQLVDEILNPKFTPVRAASYIYHFAGLDSLSFNPDNAKKRILQSLESIGRARKGADPRNLVIKAFFDAKYQEIAALFANYPDPSVYVKLSAIDPAHLTAYDEARSKRE
jgi:hypothetical protein